MAQQAGNPLITDAFANAPASPLQYYLELTFQLLWQQIYLTTSYSQAVQDHLADEVVILAREAATNLITAQY